MFYYKLPRISRTPSPPREYLRMRQNMGGASLPPVPDDDFWEKHESGGGSRTERSEEVAAEQDKEEVAEVAEQEEEEEAERPKKRQRRSRLTADKCRERRRRKSAGVDWSKVLSDVEDDGILDCIVVKGAVLTVKPQENKGGRTRLVSRKTSSRRNSNGVLSDAKDGGAGKAKSTSTRRQTSSPQELSAKTDVSPPERSSSSRDMAALSSITEPADASQSRNEPQPQAASPPAPETGRKAPQEKKKRRVKYVKPYQPPPAEGPVVPQIPSTGNITAGPSPAQPVIDSPPPFTSAPSVPSFDSLNRATFLPPITPDSHRVVPKGPRQEKKKLPAPKVQRAKIARPRLKASSQANAKLRAANEGKTARDVLAQDREVPDSQELQEADSLTSTTMREEPDASGRRSEILSLISRSPVSAPTSTAPKVIQSLLSLYPAETAAQDTSNPSEVTFSIWRAGELPPNDRETRHKIAGEKVFKAGSWRWQWLHTQIVRLTQFSRSQGDELLVDYRFTVESGKDLAEAADVLTRKGNHQLLVIKTDSQGNFPLWVYESMAAKRKESGEHNDAEGDEPAPSTKQKAPAVSGLGAVQATTSVASSFSGTEPVKYLEPAQLSGAAEMSTHHIGPTTGSKASTPSPVQPLPPHIVVEGRSSEQIRHNFPVTEVVQANHLQSPERFNSLERMASPPRTPRHSVEGSTSGPPVESTDFSPVAPCMSAAIEPLSPVLPAHLHMGISGHEHPVATGSDKGPAEPRTPAGLATMIYGPGITASVRSTASNRTVFFSDDDVYDGEVDGGQGEVPSWVKAKPRIVANLDQQQVASLPVEAPKPRPPSRAESEIEMQEAPSADAIPEDVNPQEAHSPNSETLEVTVVAGVASPTNQNVTEPPSLDVTSTEEQATEFLGVEPAVVDQSKIEHISPVTNTPVFDSPQTDQPNSDLPTTDETTTTVVSRTDYKEISNPLPKIASADKTNPDLPATDASSINSTDIGTPPRLATGKRLFSSRLYAPKLPPRKRTTIETGHGLRQGGKTFTGEAMTASQEFRALIDDEDEALELQLQPRVSNTDALLRRKSLARGIAAGPRAPSRTSSASATAGNTKKFLAWDDDDDMLERLDGVTKGGSGEKEITRGEVEVDIEDMEDLELVL